MNNIIISHKDCYFGVNIKLAKRLESAMQFGKVNYIKTMDYKNDYVIFSFITSKEMKQAISDFKFYKQGRDVISEKQYSDLKLAWNKMCDKKNKIA